MLWLVSLLWIGFALISLIGLMTGKDRSSLDLTELDGKPAQAAPAGAVAASR